MINLSTYKRLLGSKGSSEGHARKIQSDMIMEYTWNRDLQAKVCYLYDYFHDDEPSKNKDLNSMTSLTKTPIEAKFIISTYNTDDQDQVSYHIQFKPSQECNVDYYESNLAKLCGSEFPIGLVYSPL